MVSQSNMAHECANNIVHLDVLTPPILWLCSLEFGMEFLRGLLVHHDCAALGYVLPDLGSLSRACTVTGFLGRGNGSEVYAVTRVDSSTAAGPSGRSPEQAERTLVRSLIIMNPTRLANGFSIYDLNINDLYVWDKNCLP